MTFKTYLSVFGSDDKKHDLERKFGYKFRALESVYPNADKLPDDEIQKAIDMFYEGSPNESTDVMLNRVKDYTAKNEPMWNEKYFNPKPKPVQTSLPQAQTNNLQPNMPNLMQKPKLKGFGDYMAENVADMAYGADKALSGATFGGYDWLKRKTGIGVNETDYLNMKRYNNGTDKFAKIGGTISEIGGNIVGGGRGLVNGLQKSGLKGFPLATATGAIGGGLYGLTSSNKLNEVPYNTTLGAVSGSALGGLGYLGYRGANNLYNNTILPKYNSWQIGRGYDRLLQNPYQGRGSDIITRMKNHNGENVLLQRGEAIPGEGGKVITSGKLLKKATGTERNYGLNKAIYKHGITREQTQMIPQYLRKHPTESNIYGQDVYNFQTPNGNLRLVTSTKDGGKTLSSMYLVDR